MKRPTHEQMRTVAEESPWNGKYKTKTVPLMHFRISCVPSLIAVHTGLSNDKKQINIRNRSVYLILHQMAVHDYTILQSVFSFNFICDIEYVTQNAIQ